MQDLKLAGAFAREVEQAARSAAAHQRQPMSQSRRSFSEARRRDQESRSGFDTRLIEIGATL